MALTLVLRRQSNWATAYQQQPPVSFDTNSVYQNETSTLSNQSQQFKSNSDRRLEASSASSRAPAKAPNLIDFDDDKWADDEDTAWESIDTKSK